MYFQALMAQKARGLSQSPRQAGLQFLRLNLTDLADHSCDLQSNSLACPTTLNDIVSPEIHEQTIIGADCKEDESYLLWKKEFLEEKSSDPAFV
ncbi:hypothetical protein BTVI_121348 [Pitangus sulphuratus]|nr:hypothetical protein BTVI_121348 [Pitangus sulphuratus]